MYVPIISNSPKSNAHRPKNECVPIFSRYQKNAESKNTCHPLTQVVLNDMKAHTLRPVTPGKCEVTYSEVGDVGSISGHVP